MENKIANRQVMCDVLIDKATKNKDILVLTSDSRGSASLTNFAKALPNQIIEVGIAEQNIVSIAAGLALNGKRPFVASPASFLSMRSIEQVKVDVAYSFKNVKLVGISGGVSYGALGMSHHSLQDLAVTRAIPNLQVLLPSDRHETKAMFEYLATSKEPAYIRLGRNPVADVFDETYSKFELGKMNIVHQGDDITFVAAGETLRVALDAALLLEKEGIHARVLNAASIKPFDTETLLKAAKETKHIISIEEHSVHGGLGSAVAECVSESAAATVKIIAIPDESVVTGNTQEVFQHYGITKENIKEVAKKIIHK
ncbi:MAG: transketolase family protein [Breznakia sp.]